MKKKSPNIDFKLTAREGSRVPARLSYPYLFEPYKGPKGDQDPKYTASFILDKKANAADIKRLQEIVDQIVREMWGDPKKVKLRSCCLRDGSEKEDKEGYGPDVMFLTTSADGEGPRPGVVDAQLRDLHQEDGKPYAGCYVYFTCRLWAYDNQFGKGVSCTLVNVQFVKDGEPFGEGARVAPQDDFAAVEEDSSPV